MVGRVGLALIDKRLHEIFSHRNACFGGLSVLVCGGFGQLPQGGDMPLYCTDIQKSELDRIFEYSSDWGWFVFSPTAFDPFSTSSSPTRSFSKISKTPLAM